MVLETDGDQFPRVDCWLLVVAGKDVCTLRRVVVLD